MARKHVSLKEDTHQELEKAKSPGQSFDGIITELLQNHKEQKIEVEA